jgi:hypothetical protein
MTTNVSSGKGYTPTSSVSSSSCRLKLALGSDIRRVRKAVESYGQLCQVAKRTFGKELYEDEIRYFYLDSDEERIDVSDDEDLEAAVQACKKKYLKIHIENYNIKKDPFFSDVSSAMKAETNTGATSERNQVEKSRLSMLVPSVRSEGDSMISIPDEEVSISFLKIKETTSSNGSECDELDQKMIGESIFSSMNEESKIGQRKNTDASTHDFKILDESKAKSSSRSMSRGYVD